MACSGEQSIFVFLFYRRSFGCISCAYFIPFQSRYGVSRTISLYQTYSESKVKQADRLRNRYRPLWSKAVSHCVYYAAFVTYPGKRTCQCQQDDHLLLGGHRCTENPENKKGCFLCKDLTIHKTTFSSLTIIILRY